MNKRTYPFLIGCDGGGTGCRVAVADRDGRVLAECAGGPANVTSDFAGAIANVEAALAGVAARLGMARADLAPAAAHFGLAGVMTPADAARVAAALPFAQCAVTEDRAIALAGALAGADGVLMSIGTGTIIAAQRGAQQIHIGGWGLQLSDQASGAWLGRALLERVLLCHDAMAEHSGLTRAVLDRFDGAPSRIVTFAATARAADYAALAPEIIAAAARGDDTATGLLRSGAEYLARALVVTQFRAQEALCLTGGVGPHYAGYLPAQVQPHIIAPKGSALAGALYLARLAAMTGEGRERTNHAD